MSGYEITCANRDSRGAIIRIGGEGWTLTVHEAIVRITTGQIKLMIYLDGRQAEVGIRGEGNESYLAVEPDGFPLHNLTDLQSC
jgi:hypothetical protein